MASSGYEPPPEDFDLAFGPLLDNMAKLFVVKDQDQQQQQQHDDPQTDEDEDELAMNDVESVLQCEKRIKEWRNKSRELVDHSREQLRGISLDYKQALSTSQRSSGGGNSSSDHQRQIEQMFQSTLNTMKLNSELDQQVMELQGELVRLNEELKGEEEDALQSKIQSLGSEVLKCKLYRDMGFTPILDSTNPKSSKFIVRSSRAQEARTISRESNMNDFQFANYLWEVNDGRVPPGTSEFLSSTPSTPSDPSKPIPSTSSAVLPASPIPSWAKHLPNRLKWVHPYLSLARLDKPIGTWLLFWPCAWGITMASYSSLLPPTSYVWNLVLFGTGAIIMRGAGCIINDLWDRDIDKKVERTKTRPLASGEIKPIQALTFLGTQLSLGLGILTQLNWYSIALGASSLSVVVLYPLMKRITYWPQFVLGLAFNWGALLGSSAVLGQCDWQVALPLYAGSVAWTIVYDTIYAHQDKTDDIHANVKSTALLFGDKSLPILTTFSASFLSLLTLSGYLNHQGPIFYLVSVGGAAAHLTWQLRNVEWDKRESCWKFFGSNRDLGAIVWAGLAMDYGLALAGSSGIV
ncbi:hypothetical protein JCM16303_003360 [Sporobolomyces ruberrimus]